MRALVSTSDKTGLVEFLRPLIPLGLEVVSTGGTYNYLKKENFDVIDVSHVTSFPEVLDGRVKTLHPHIHMGLLADKFNSVHVEQMKKINVKHFDLVVGNLYPFEKVATKEDTSLEELIENIDIGGPSFLRASAKNYRSVVVVSSPNDYSWVLAKLLNNSLTDADRMQLALKVFSLTSYYDALIVNRLASDSESFEQLNLPLKKKQSLRYGENSHQKASWYFNPLQAGGLNSAQFHQGKELSYNNLLDLDAAFQLCSQFTQAGCVAVKHNNPCGVAVADTLVKAVEKSIQADPKSIFGGIVAVNKKFDLACAELFKDIFLECIIAPEYSDEALALLAKKKNIRVLSLKNEDKKQTAQLRSVKGGVLAQDPDSFNSDGWKYFSSEPSTAIKSDMIFADQVVGALKSNAIAMVYHGQSIGLGMGQVNRVDAVEQALKRMKEFCERCEVNMNDVVLSSDAFFPFADSIELIAQAGIKWVIQPGGSVQDENIIAAAQEKKVNLVFTNRRHFKH
jgi:phosphoribosylaminoimidazolecarboxamide formyltransferase/IMP cyclohydrolase